MLPLNTGQPWSQRGAGDAPHTPTTLGKVVTSNREWGFFGERDLKNSLSLVGAGGLGVPVVSSSSNAAVFPDRWSLSYV